MVTNSSIHVSDYSSNRIQGAAKNEVLAIVGILCLIIIEMSTCISLVFNVHGL